MKYLNRHPIKILCTKLSFDKAKFTRWQLFVTREKNKNIPDDKKLLDKQRFLDQQQDGCRQTVKRYHTVFRRLFRHNSR